MPPFKPTGRRKHFAITAAAVLLNVHHASAFIRSSSLRSANVVRQATTTSSSSAFLPPTAVVLRAISSSSSATVSHRRQSAIAMGPPPLGAGEKVVIIGGGIVGASTAYHLSLRGIKPVVIERSAVAAAASGKAGGFLAGGWGSGPTTKMHEISFEMHEKLAETLGVTSYRKIPTLQVNGAKKGSSPAAWLDGKASGSMMDTDTAQVTPLELTTKLMDAAKSNGAEVRIAAVTGVSSAPMDSPSSEEAGSGGGSGAGDNPGGRRITGVTLESGEEVACDRVIVAMGPWSCLAEEWFDIPVPMQGIKSTSIVFKGSDAVAEDPYALFCAEDRNGCHLEVYPRPTGEVYLCGLGGSDYVDSPRLKSGGDCGKPEDILPDPRRVTAATKSFRGMTSLGNEDPAVSQACMRPCPPDGLPIMGDVPGLHGAYLSAGHNCWGILWGPVTGLLMSELLLDGKASTVDIGPFSPSRFMQKARKRGRRRGAADLVGEQW